MPLAVLGSSRSKTNSTSVWITLTRCCGKPRAQPSCGWARTRSRQRPEPLGAKKALAENTSEGRRKRATIPPTSDGVLSGYPNRRFRICAKGVEPGTHHAVIRAKSHGEKAGGYPVCV